MNSWLKRRLWQRNNCREAINNGEIKERFEILETHCNSLGNA